VARHNSAPLGRRFTWGLPAESIIADVFANCQKIFFVLDLPVVNPSRFVRSGAKKTARGESKMARGLKERALIQRQRSYVDKCVSAKWKKNRAHLICRTRAFSYKCFLYKLLSCAQKFNISNLIDSFIFLCALYYMYFYSNAVSFIYKNVLINLY